MTASLEDEVKGVLSIISILKDGLDRLSVFLFILLFFFVSFVKNKKM